MSAYCRNSPRKVMESPVPASPPRRRLGVKPQHIAAQQRQIRCADRAQPARAPGLCALLVIHSPAVDHSVHSVYNGLHSNPGQ